ncbi:MFS transporter [Plantibacter sp. YIM 135347]|uniref:MFS transporter n=1 Tax=Plantibacter sp. YIM 135347 TaxID=3423919 RepID=UPI003D34178A
MTPPTDTAVPLSPPTASMPIVGVRPAWRDTFTSLRVPNFRLFTIGHIVATTAIGMQRIAQDWLVLELSGSVAAVGVTVAMQFAPMLVFGLLGGVLADRYPKRILLMITQSLAAALAVVLSVLALTGAVQVWHIYVIAFLLGLVTVVDTPARQSFVSELVGPHRLPNAISINSAVFQLGQLVGPAVGGLMITAIGSGWSFAINAVACCGVVLTLSLMNVKALMPTKPMPRAKGQMAEGVRYAVRKPAILWTVVMLAFVSVFALNMPVLLAAYASQVFDIGPGGYGLLNALVAAGALTGALASTRRGGVDLRIVIGTAAAIGVLQATTGLMPSLFLFCALLVGGGVATLLFITAANSLVQLSANAGIRGRVMALYVLVLLGGQAIGGPLMGWLVEHAGPHVGMVVSGAVPALAAGVVTLVLLAKRRRARAAVAASADADTDAGADADAVVVEQTS